MAVDLEGGVFGLEGLELDVAEEGCVDGEFVEVVWVVVLEEAGELDDVEGGEGGGDGARTCRAPRRARAR